MARKNISWKTKGMNRDMSVSAFNAEFAFENVNLRLSTNEGNTMMSWVNERGTKEMVLHIDTQPWNTGEVEDRYADAIVGTVIGIAVLNHQLVLFTKDGDDAGDDCYIYVFKVSNADDIDFEGKILHRGALGFDVKHPIETLVSYESENIQKVYWTDNLNQPRVINIAHVREYNDGSFDFVQELALKEEVKVTKIFGSGEFPAGVIQYAFTYYNKYGQESNVFYTTPLQYISYVDRGGSADSKIANSFRIEVSNIDRNFDYLRIYSILRTSKDATPFCKRVQDIEITDDNVTFIDTGLQGDSVDPTELLYLGGEEICAETMEQKDGTLFFGNIKTTQPPILNIKDAIMDITGVTREHPLANDKVTCVTSERKFMVAFKEPFSYINTLSAPEGTTYEGASGFKAREYYRLGLQFQYKNGKWSEPCWIGDKQQEVFPRIDQALSNEDIGTIYIPEFRVALSKEDDAQEDMFKTLYNAGYRKVRPLFAVPSFSDRTILCQGVGCPTMFRKADRYADSSSENFTSKKGNEGKLYAQSSWLFRTPVAFQKTVLDYENGDASNGGGKVSYMGKLKSQFETDVIAEGDRREDDYTKVMSPYLRDTEVMGKFDDEHTFYVDDMMATIHSPEMVFDTSLSAVDFSGCKMDMVGGVSLLKTFGDIDVQTSSPALGSDAGGFVHRSVVTDGSAALISAPFYEDHVVCDPSSDKYEPYQSSKLPIMFPLYMWHKNGSLNNDVSRANRSAELLKKKMSNYRLGDSTVYKGLDDCSSYSVDDIQLFSSEELLAVKVGGHVYMGNIETMLTPQSTPHYFIGSPDRDENKGDDKIDFNTDAYFCLRFRDYSDNDSKPGIWKWKKLDISGFEKYWTWCSYASIGENIRGLCQWREPISIKYKSTPHLVVKLTGGDSFGSMLNSNGIFKATKGVADFDTLPVVEIVKPYDADTFFGGTSDDVMKQLTWIPCGPAYSFGKETEKLDIEFKWGDTYFQRYECLKTYPFTQEDKNQVVEIASFMCESRVNMDGRYDRNRAQTSNLNMTPQNFNLLNPVYSQMDNFFSYKMLDEDDYENVSYPNNITWTKTKENGADIDLWTNITLANVLELDGNKGEITKLTRLNNQLLAFQDKGISQILYNENTQISTTEGVPIEIANSEKVQGKRYLSDTVGCSNKWSIAQTPVGIYFMDSNEKSIYLFKGQLNNISTTGGFNSWCKQHIPSANEKWNPVEFGNFVTYYDKLNQDVLFINKNTALAYSEKFNCFTSFYDYGRASYLDYLDDMGIWVKDGKLWKHQTGEYCQFFDDNKPFSMTLVANQEPQLDKIFTNLEFRACVNGEGTYDESTDKFVPSLPFDTLEAWDEYQHGIISLSNKNKGNKFTHGLMEGILARKFRIWGCDIPRDNVTPDAVTEAPLGIKRFKARPLDRIRNTWAYLKLSKHAAEKDKVLSKTEVHDIMASYFA